MSEVTSRLSTALAGRYKIESRLGEGGMATVYLAEDLKHKRKVAIKVLRAELAAVLGAERFVQEITTTANLQHPHILPLFDSGEADSFLYYVMPVIDGETLREKLDRETQLSIEEAVKITTEVADALHYAHGEGVIHRDIKPENILMHNGRPMVADFGIALAVSAAAGGRMTETGLSLGTPHYMSTEQATAEKEITAKSDVYSLGAMLYEMLTGDPPHTGSSAQQIIMKIVTEDAQPVTQLRKSVPPHVAAATAKALEKLPADRFGAANDFAAALSDTAFTVSTSSAAAAMGGPSARTAPYVMLGISTIAIIATVAALFGWLRPIPRDVLRVGVMITEGEGGAFFVQNRLFALAPDGSRVVYPGRATDEGVLSQLWVHDLDSPASRPLLGTAGGVAPFFSPDGEQVAFIADGQLRVVTVTGGAARTLITDSVMAWGGAWSGDGWLYVTMERRLNRVRSTGGAVEVVSVPDSTRGESFHEYPDVHPNNKQVLIQLWIQSVQDTEIGILSLETGEVNSLGKAVNGRFIDEGRIAYVTHEGDLLVAPYDEDAMAFAAPGSVLERGVRIDDMAGAGIFDVSETGHLVYAPGRERATDRVVWVDRSGNATPVDQEWGGPFYSPRLSPNGDRLAVIVANAGGMTVWVKEISGGLPLPLTFQRGPFRSPAWSPGGLKVAYIDFGSFPATIWDQNANGSGQATQVGIPPSGFGSVTWSPSGHLVYDAAGIYAWHPDGESMEVVPEEENNVWAPEIGPDGQWLAYVSNELGRPEVWLTRFPNAGEDKWRISLEGGTEPAWGRSGRELFVRTLSGHLAARSLQLGDVVILGDVDDLFDASEFQSNPFEREYDVAPDGQRFIMVRPGAATSTLMMVYNWAEELKALAR